MVYNSFYMWFKLVCQYSVEDFCAYMHKRYWSVSFFMISLPAFSIRVIMTSQSELGSVSCLSVLWRNLRRIGIHLKYMFGLITCEAIWAWAFKFVGNFLITNSIAHLFQIVCILLLLDFCCCCFSVPQLCLTLCDPMDCSMPGSPVLHHLPEFAQIHVH